MTEDGRQNKEGERLGRWEGEIKPTQMTEMAEVGRQIKDGERLGRWEGEIKP